MTRNSKIGRKNYKAFYNDPHKFKFVSGTGSAKNKFEAAKDKRHLKERAKVDREAWLEKAIDPKTSRHTIKGAWHSILHGQPVMFATDGYRFHAVYDPDKSLGDMIMFKHTPEYFAECKKVDTSTLIGELPKFLTVETFDFVRALAVCEAFRPLDSHSNAAHDPYMVTIVRITVVGGNSPVMELYTKNEVGDVAVTIPCKLPSVWYETWAHTFNLDFLKDAIDMWRGYETMKMGLRVIKARSFTSSSPLILKGDHAIAGVMPLSDRG